MSRSCTSTIAYNGHMKQRWAIQVTSLSLLRNSRFKDGLWSRFWPNCLPRMEDWGTCLFNLAVIFLVVGGGIWLGGCILPSSFEEKGQSILNREIKYSILLPIPNRQHILYVFLNRPVQNDRPRDVDDSCRLNDCYRLSDCYPKMCNVREGILAA